MPSKKCHRVLDEPHPIKVRIHIWQPRAARLTPRHEYIYIDRPSRHFSFAPSLCQPPTLFLYPRYFIYIDGTCLSLGEGRFNAVFIGNPVYHEPQSTANDPFVLRSRRIIPESSLRPAPPVSVNVSWPASNLSNIVRCLAKLNRRPRTSPIHPSDVKNNGY